MIRSYIILALWLHRQTGGQARCFNRAVSFNLHNLSVLFLRMCLIPYLPSVSRLGHLFPHILQHRIVHQHILISSLNINKDLNITAMFIFNKTGSYKKQGVEKLSYLIQQRRIKSNLVIKRGQFYLHLQYCCVRLANCTVHRFDKHSKIWVNVYTHVETVGPTVFELTSLGCR